MCAALDPLSPTHRDMVVRHRDYNTFTFYVQNQIFCFFNPFKLNQILT